MGIINTKDFQEMHEEGMPPPTPPKVKYTEEEDFDPRSPTLGITRTPVQILKLPQQLDDPRSPTTGIERTPICPLQSNSKVKVLHAITPATSSRPPVLEDPRSPTQGIDRTPICAGKIALTRIDVKGGIAENLADAVPDLLDDPRSPTQGISRTPICSIKEKELELESSPIQAIASTDACELDVKDIDILDEVLSKPIKMSSLEDFVDVISEQIHEDLMLKLPALDHDEETTEAITQKKETNRQKPKTVVAHTNVDTTDFVTDYQSSKQSKDKSIVTRSPLKVLGDRSPLSSRNVDYNSPRAIVQRKQSSKVGMKKNVLQMKPFASMKNSPKYKTMEEEKENM